MKIKAILNDWIIKSYVVALMILFSQKSIASGAVSELYGVGLVAHNVTSSFTDLTKLITAGSYLGGLAFFIAAIMKFKQHKDNPTQVPIGTPIALVFIAGSMLFLPSILGITGATMFGTSGGQTSGPTGTIYESN